MTVFASKHRLLTAVSMTDLLQPFSTKTYSQSLPRARAPGRGRRRRRSSRAHTATRESSRTYASHVRRDDRATDAGVGRRSLVLTMLASVVLLAATVVTLAAGEPAPQCSLLLKGKGYRENLNGQHVRTSAFLSV